MTDKKNPNQRRQADDLLETKKRRAFVLELRKAGATYAVIVKAAVKKFGADRLPSGWDCRYAYNDIKRELDKLNKECQQTVADLRRLETERIDMALFAIAGAVKKGHLGAIDRFVKLSARRARLCGLDAPLDLDVTNKGDITIRIVRNGTDSKPSPTP